MLDTCNIVGGGPAGLYLAYLLRRRGLARRVNVLEQNPPDATFGFGVVLSENGLRQFEEFDAPSHAAMAQLIHPLRNQRIKLRGADTVVDAPQAGGGVQRLALLELLQRLCRDAGVSLSFNQRVVDVESLAQCDLLVGADGLASAVRKHYASDFGATERDLTNRFAWYGVERTFDMPTLSFLEHGTGTWIAHYYQYSASMSTFLIECDAATWERSDLTRASEPEQRAFAESIFAADLGGGALVHNHSLWRRFTVVRNTRWHVRNVTLLGDALHTIHFSIGSGTRVAMEDSIALIRSLEASGGIVSSALPLYESQRRPLAAKLAEAAERSFEWYERVSEHVQQDDPMEFAYRYLTRTGRVDDQRLASMAPMFAARYSARLAGSPATSPAEKEVDA
jgi:2-polyprenyl-6-methoxyphenol hydroxylase-like FAD-dependent oxidoreductase